MVAETTLVSGIAGRYATALFELAADRKAMDQVAGDVEQLGRMIEGSPELQRVLRSPVLSRGDQLKAMTAILGRAGANDLTRRFVGLVAQNRRLFALSDIVRDFGRLLAHHRGEQSGEVVSAQPLADDQLAAIKKQLAGLLGSEVRLSAKVDPNLLGGLIVKIGSRMMDASLRTKLQRLKLAMKGAG
ncbi:MAG: F0F1 ATP synthase subunit delta [Alphaproteobacteria bacterium]|nr:F0F1 ATP synthase subunit delta [Alphaproteobacteria bacterium]